MFIPVRDDNPLRSIRAPWVTIAIITITALTYGLELTDALGPAAASFALVPAELFQVGPGWWGGPALGPNDIWPVPERATLLTYMMLHSDLLHLATNMLFLWVFGDNVEDAMGHGRFAIFYLLCGSAACLAHAFAMPGSKIPLIGASGAVAGIVAAYVLLHPSVRVWVLALRIIPLNISAAVALGSWIVVQVAMLFVQHQGTTAWFAHVGGIVAGAALVVVLRRKGLPLWPRHKSKE
jgi:membrane associated rhomboid family serine protease